MSLPVFLLIIFSVSLSAFAQIMLKLGMSSPQVVQILANSNGFLSLVWILLTPKIVLGILLFGSSALVWLAVLSKIDVSLAYPCMAAGIVMTIFFGYFFGGETITATRLLGAAIITAGVCVVAFGT